MANATDWFRRRTFHHSRFADLEALAEAKAARDLTVSVCIPALNEASTITPIVRGIREAFVERVPLVDELVVMDSASGDETVALAEEAGAAVVQDADVLPRLEPAAGKGEAMWKSLFVLKGDVILWLDGDIENFDPRFVYGPLGPLLTDPEVRYVKAFYERPLKVGQEIRESEGGRVTEILARPLLNMFWPDLAGIVQPLSGEYAGHREVLESVPFFTGYGVEIGLVIDIAERFGIEAFAQVDLERRDHRNRTVRELSRMASAILQVAVARLASSGRIELHADPSRMLAQLVREELTYGIETTEIRIHERPPAISVPEYRTR